MYYMEQNFRDNNNQDPQYDKDVNIVRFLQRHYKGYKIWIQKNNSRKRSHDASCGRSIVTKLQKNQDQLGKSK